MTTINTNISSVLAIQRLQANNSDLNLHMQRLSSGLKINSAKDDPAGLIAVENLKTQGNGLQQVIDNASRADSVMGTAEGSLNQVSSLLTQLQTLITQSANRGGLTDAEISANQQQVDSILSSIDRIANSTTFNGKNLLNGNLGYVTSGVTGADITALQVNQAQVSTGSPQTVQVGVTAAATHGQVTYTGISSGGSDYVTGAATIQLTGTKGSSTNINITAAETLAQAQTAINAQTATTGVSATVSGAVLLLDATGLGNSAFVSVQPVAGAFTTNVLSARGTDAAVTVNGQAASTTGSNVNYHGTTLDLSLSMSDAFAGAAGSTTFYVTGGGANFMLGATVTAGSTVGVGIGSVTTGSLGNSIDGYLASLGSGQANSLAGNLTQAQVILNTSINQVSTLRGKLGAFQKNILDPNVQAVQVALENVTASRSAIQDADFATETAAMTRAQILVQAGTSVLSMANTAPQAVLALLKNA